MEYTERVGFHPVSERALITATVYHAGQVDKLGAAYILHPLRVARKFEDPYRRAIAYLHDVVEDTNLTMEYIRAHFPFRVAEGVDAMTRREGEMYADYLARVVLNPDALLVKIEDVRDNMDRPERPHSLAMKGLTKRYEKSLAYLLEQLDRQG